MYFHRSLVAFSLVFASGSHAAPPEGHDRRAVRGRDVPITVTNNLPATTIVSPQNAMCPVSYTTVFSSLGTNAGGQGTGLAPHTYTMTYQCDSSPGSPCKLPPNEVCPPGFTTTTTVCHKCAGGPVTYTLTVPDADAAAAAATGQAGGSTGGGNAGGSSGGSPGNNAGGNAGGSNPGGSNPGGSNPGGVPGDSGKPATGQSGAAAAPGVTGQAGNSQAQPTGGANGGQGGQAAGGSGGSAGGGANAGDNKASPSHVIASAASPIGSGGLWKTMQLLALLAGFMNLM